MREILFRGKRTDNGEWTTWNAVTGIHGLERIEDDTICQCTGLKDKNGKMIWENDIMVAHIDDVFPEDETYTKVLWHNNGFCTNENHSIDIEPIDEFDKIHFEVCGNIFDNPELLEK